MKTRAYDTLPSYCGLQLKGKNTGNHMIGDEAPYWGVLCRSCMQLVAFDVRPYRSFGPEGTNIKPGSIRCVNGHNHIYYPRDFQFFFSEVAISDAAMQQNREAFMVINRPSPASSNRVGGPGTIDRVNSPGSASGNQFAASNGATVKPTNRGWFSFIKALVKEAIAVRFSHPISRGRAYQKPVPRRYA